MKIVLDADDRVEAYKMYAVERLEGFMDTDCMRVTLPTYGAGDVVVEIVKKLPQQQPQEQPQE